MKTIKMIVGREMKLKATKKNYEIAIARSMSRDGGEYAVGSENGMIKIVRTL